MSWRNTFIYSILSLTVFSFNACELINPEENIPSYLYIQDFELKTNSLEGSSRVNATDLWLFIANDPRGIHELPATIPVIDKGAPKITISAGVLENGISSTRQAYPFFEPYILNDTGS